MILIAVVLFLPLMVKAEEEKINFLFARKSDLVTIVTVPAWEAVRTSLVLQEMIDEGGHTDGYVYSSPPYKSEFEEIELWIEGEDGPELISSRKSMTFLEGSQIFIAEEVPEGIILPDEKIGMIINLRVESFEQASLIQR